MSEKLKRMLCRFDAKAAAESDDGQMRFSGLGAAFNNLDSYGDTIRKGAFKRTLKEAKSSGIWPVMLSQHGAWGMTSEDLTPVGVWDSLTETDEGLQSDGILAPTERGTDFYKLMKMKPRPAINGLSIGFIPRKWKLNQTPKEDEPRREITDIDLIEISLVTFPANTNARVTDVMSERLSKRDIERILRDSGVPNQAAKRIASSANFLEDEEENELDRRDDDEVGIATELRDALLVASLKTTFLQGKKP